MTKWYHNARVPGTTRERTAMRVAKHWRAETADLPTAAQHAAAADKWLAARISSDEPDDADPTTST